MRLFGMTDLVGREGNKRSKRISVFAAGTFLVLCLSAAVLARFLPYDPAAAAGSETFWDFFTMIGTMLLPVASVCFAKRLFAGHRFRFVLSWLVGFLIPWSLLIYEVLFPNVPPEGSYLTETEECVGITIFIAILSLLLNIFDSLAERLLHKLKRREIRYV